MSIAKCSLFILLVLARPAFSAVAASQGESAVGITHDAISCWPYDDFVVIQADIGPPAEVGTARVYFRATDFVDFYYVEMARNQEGLFEAVMPQPSQKTTRVIYYIEAVDQEFNAAQTAEYDPTVSPSGSCSYRRFIGVPSIVIGSLVTNVPAVPAGFQAIGITGFTSAGAGGGAATGAAAGGAAGAAAGGLSTAAIVGIGAGAAAAAAVGVKAATGGDDGAEADNDGDGFTVSAGDCDDNDPSINPNGAVTFTNGRFQPDTTVCPTGVPSRVDLSIRFTGRSNRCSAVNVTGVTGEVTITRVQNTIDSVGAVIPINATANPNSIPARGTADFRAVQILNCTNPSGGPFGFVEARGAITVATSAGNSNLTLSNEWRVNFPLSAPEPTTTSVGTRGLRAGNTGAGTAQTPPSQRSNLNWSSELTVRGGRGQVTFNGTSGSFSGAGRSQASSIVQAGTNVVEALLVAGSGRAGTWRFDLGNTGDLERGSIEVRMGQVELLTESSIVFRLNGSVGERVSFSFRVRH